MSGYVASIYNALVNSGPFTALSNSRPVAAVVAVATKVRSAFSAIPPAEVEAHNPVSLAGRVVVDASSPKKEEEHKCPESYNGSVPVEMTMSGSMDSMPPVETSRIDDSGIGSIIVVDSAETAISRTNSVVRTTFPSLYDSGTAS